MPDIKHILPETGPGDGTTLSSGVTTPTEEPKTKFKIDSGFKAVLTKIGLMEVVLNDISKKQDETIKLLKVGIKAGESIDEKVDRLQETLDDMVLQKEQEMAEEEKRRREEETERNYGRNATTGAEAVDKPDLTPPSLPSSIGWAITGIAAASLLAPYKKEIAAFVGFLRSSSSVLAYLGGTASGAVQSAKLASPSLVKALEIGGRAGANAAAPSRAMINVLKWLKFLQKAAWFLLLVDPLITMAQAYLFGTNGEPFMRIMAKSFGRVVGSLAGATAIGALGGILGGILTGGVGAPVGLVCGAIAGGYMGVGVGEAFGAALYDLFASDMGDWSGFGRIWDSISKDIQGALDSAYTSIEGTAKDTYDWLVGNPKTPPTPPTKEPVVPPMNVPSRNNNTKTNLGGLGRPGYNTVAMFPDQDYPYNDYTPNKSDPLTWRTNNPGAIRGGDSVVKARGGIGRTNDAVSASIPNTGTLRFKSAAEGFAAMARLLIEYHAKGRNTIKKIMSLYAPPSHNDTKQYIASLCRTLGVKEDDILNINDDKVLFALMRAISSYEGGRSKRSGVRSEKYWRDEDIWAGIDIARGRKSKDDLKPPPATPNVTAPPSGFNMKEGAKDGGENEPALDVLAEQLSQEGLLKRATAFNDNPSSHNKGSKHPQGLAMDFSLNDPKDADRVITRIKQLASAAGVKGIHIKNELTRPPGQKVWSGPHIHVEFRTHEDAKKFYDYYKQKERETTTSPIAVPVPSEPRTGSEMIKASGGKEKSKIVVMASPQVAPQQSGGGNSPPARAGISGPAPASFNFNIPSFLNVIN